MSRGKHAAPSNAGRYARNAAIGTTGSFAGLALLVSTAAPAWADATDAEWSAVIDCESNGRNVESVSTASSASGYFQITDGTWRGAGGQEFAPRAIDATYEQQLIVANRIHTAAGGTLRDWNASRSCWEPRLAAGAPVKLPAPTPPPAPVEPPPAPEPVPEESKAEPVDAVELEVVKGDTLSELAPAAGAATWQDLYAQNVDVVGANPHLIFPGQRLTFVGGLVLPTPPVPVDVPAAPPVEEEPAEVVVEPAEGPEQVAEVPPPPPPAFGLAPIKNSAGPVSQNAQMAADRVFTNVPGSQLITIGGTRSSAHDPNGHPAGNALDYMVLGDTALGNAIVDYHIAHWQELNVEYVIWRQQILYGPDQAWKGMENRGSPTANHMDHPHVNYR